MNNEENKIYEILYFILLKLYYFKQNVPFELLFNIPILLISLKASFSFASFQNYIKSIGLIILYQLVALSFFLWNFLEYFVIKNDIFTNVPLIFASILIVYLINTLFEDNKVELDENIPIEQDSNMTIKWNTPNSVFWLKAFISLEFFISLTMLFYAHNSINWKTRNRFLIQPYLYYTINVIINAIIYLCLFRWKWMQFEWLTYRLMNVSSYQSSLIKEESYQIRLIKIQVSFYMAIYPASKQFSGELCTICQYLGPNAHFCLYHCFHESCLIPFLIDKTKIILNESHIKCVCKRFFKNDVRTPDEDYMTFEVKVKRDNLPFCPNCKQHFDLNIIEIQIEDYLKNKMISAAVEIIG